MLASVLSLLTVVSSTTVCAVLVGAKVSLAVNLLQYLSITINKIINSIGIENFIRLFKSVAFLLGLFVSGLTFFLIEGALPRTGRPANSACEKVTTS